MGPHCSVALPYVGLAECRCREGPWETDQCQEAQGETRDRAALLQVLRARPGTKSHSPLDFSEKLAKGTDLTKRQELGPHCGALFPPDCPVG